MSERLNSSKGGSRPQKGKRKDIILDAFNTLIDRYGMDKTTMQEIADTAGISVGTLYNEFKDKDALIDALVDRLELELGQNISEIEFKSESPEEQIYELIMKISKLISELLQNKRSVLDYFLTGTRKFRYIGKKIRTRDQNRGRVQKRIREIIERGIDLGLFEVEDIDMAVKVIAEVHVTYTLAQIFMMDQGGLQDEELRDFGIRLLIKGLRKS